MSRLILESECSHGDAGNGRGVAAQRRPHADADLGRPGRPPYHASESDRFGRQGSYRDGAPPPRAAPYHPLDRCALHEMAFHAHCSSPACTPPRKMLRGRFTEGCCGYIGHSTHRADHSVADRPASLCMVYMVVGRAAVVQRFIGVPVQGRGAPERAQRLQQQGFWGGAASSRGRTPPGSPTPPRSPCQEEGPVCSSRCWQLPGRGEPSPLGRPFPCPLTGSLISWLSFWRSIME